MRALIVVLLFTLLAACAGPTFIVQQYGGPARPHDTIATLRVNGAEQVRLLFLDEEDVAAPLVSDGRLHIELLPGRHTLMARKGEDRTAPTGSFTFVAEANKVYRVLFDGETAQLWEVDRDSDKPTREVTAPPREISPPAREVAAPPPPESVVE